MRLRNVKNKQEILDASSLFISDPTIYKGKWQEVFNNTNPIFIEIGMGKGQFLLENAKKYPDINFIGIERYDSVLARALPKMEIGLNNLRVIRMNAIDIETVFDHEIDRIYLNFSDPWPKKRHESRRLMCTLFLEKYDSIFRDQKEIEMKTDNPELFEFALVSFSQYGYQLYEVNLDLHHFIKEDEIMTEYEEKFVRAGKPIYYCKVAQRREK